MNININFERKKKGTLLCQTQGEALENTQQYKQSGGKCTLKLDKKQHKKNKNHNSGTSDHFFNKTQQ